jgi:hypothetical protein
MDEMSSIFPYAEGLMMDAAPLTLPQLLEQNPLFASMSVDEATYLRSVGNQRTVAAGQQVLASGSPGDALIIDFWITFIRSGDRASRPGQIRMYDAGSRQPRYLELHFVED